MTALLKTTILITCLLNLSQCTSQATTDVRFACEYACLNADQKTTSGACVLECTDYLLNRFEENALESLLRDVKEEETSQIEISPENLYNFETDLDDGDDRKYRENLLRRSRAIMSRRGSGTNDGGSWWSSIWPTQMKKERSMRPHYLRVGRRSDNTNNYDLVDLLQNDYDDKVYEKRASRFVRIGKSTPSSYEGVATGQLGQRSNEMDVEKKNVRPSKYVRIGKRNVDTEQNKLNSQPIKA